jgi:hypothetical protein
LFFIAVDIENIVTWQVDAAVGIRIRETTAVMQATSDAFCNAMLSLRLFLGFR